MVQAEQTTAQWLALLRAPNYGVQRLLPLIKKTPHIGAFFNHSQLSFTLPEKLKVYLTNPNWQAVEQDLKWLEEKNNHFIAITDPQYPTLLKEISDPPLGLFVCGDIDLLQFPQIAMVGSRNASQSGAQIARQFAQHLGSNGVCITSGMAVGIDAESHKGALKGHGKTIAVAGTGLDRVYPAQHRELAHQIAEQGALVSEFFPGTPPQANNFPRRNRIISGLSLGTLIVEATLKSGSLITGRLAMEQGREVFAIPGSIHNPMAKGCHQLIRQGAKLVETSQDILEDLMPMLSLIDINEIKTTEKQEQAVESDFLTAEYQDLLTKMDFNPISIDKITERTGLTSAEISSMLLVLELNDYIESLAGGNYQRLK